MPKERLPHQRGAGPHPDRGRRLRARHDDGCEVWHACLSCPLPRCIYDEPRRGRGAAKRLRDADIARLSREGWTANQLAERYRLSRRQIIRIRRREREQS
jgi:hypothetical protein